MNEVAKVDGALAIQSNQQKFEIAQLRALGLEGADEGAVMTFLHYCQRTQLDPFARQLYMIGRNETKDNVKTTKWTIQMGIDGFRIIAQRSFEYQGQTAPEWCGADGVWKEVWLDNKPPSAARIGVRRKGFVEPLYAVALWDSYAVSYWDNTAKGYVLSAMWKKHGPGQLAKCAEALALRKAFPMDLSGIYEPTEMEAMDVIEENGAREKEDKPNMTRSVTVVESEIVFTDDQINTASQLIDHIDNFNTSAEIKTWVFLPEIVPFHDVPVNKDGLTISIASKERYDQLVEQEKNSHDGK